MERKIKSAPKQCQNYCSSLEIMTAHHNSKNGARINTILEIVPEIESQISSLQTKNVVVGSVVREAIFAKVDYSLSPSKTKSLYAFYGHMVRSHLAFFNLIYNEDMQAIQKLDSDLQRHPPAQLCHSPSKLPPGSPKDEPNIHPEGEVLESQEAFVKYEKKKKMRKRNGSTGRKPAAKKAKKESNDETNNEQSSETEIDVTK